MPVPQLQALACCAALAIIISGIGSSCESSLLQRHSLCKTRVDYAANLLALKLAVISTTLTHFCIIVLCCAVCSHLKPLSTCQVCGFRPLCVNSVGPCLCYVLCTHPSCCAFLSEYTVPQMPSRFDTSIPSDSLLSLSHMLLLPLLQNMMRQGDHWP